MQDISVKEEGKEKRKESGGRSKKWGWPAH